MRLTDEHTAFRASVRAFVESEINPHVDEWEEAGMFPAAWAGLALALGTAGVNDFLQTAFVALMRHLKRVDPQNIVIMVQPENEVGTYGSVKAMLPHELKETGAQIVLGNTFHLWLRPGTDVLNKMRSSNSILGVKSRIGNSTPRNYVLQLAT